MLPQIVVEIQTGQRILLNGLRIELENLFRHRPLY
jgi:hypothetical protein